MDKTDKQILIEARDILADRQRWGRSVLLDHDGCYCLLGAVGKAAGLPDDELLGDAADSAYATLRDMSVTRTLANAINDNYEFGPLGIVYKFNDRAYRNDNHAAIMNVLDDAIEAAA